MGKRILSMAVAFVFGFIFSFGIFACMTVVSGIATSPTLRGQLVAGGPNIYSSYSTTAGIVANADQNPVVIALSSYVWWLGVVVGAIIATIFFMETILKSIVFLSDAVSPLKPRPQSVHAAEPANAAPNIPKALTP